MPSQDAHDGGDLYDMAKNGTTMPNDAGKLNIDHSKSNTSTGQGNNTAAAYNPTDMPRGVADVGATGEVVTGTGDDLPAAIENKRLYTVEHDQSAERFDKSIRKQKGDKEEKEDGVENFPNDGPTKTWGR